MVFALVSLVAPLQSLAAEPAPSEPHHGQSEEEEHSAGSLIFHQFVGEKIYIQDQGELYILFEAEYEKSKHERALELAAELSIGVTERLQLVAEVPFKLVDPDDGSQHEGLGDTTLGLQYNLIQEPDFAVGLRSGFVVPTGDEDRGLGGGQFVWEPNLMGALRVGHSEIYAAVGSEIYTDNDVPNAFTYTVSGAYPWRQLIGTLELGGTLDSDEHEMYLAPGIFWNAVDYLQIGIGAPIGLTRDSDDFQITTVFVFEFF